MKIVRWVLFVPLAALAALFFAVTWSDLMPNELIFEFLKRMLGVTMFILLGLAIAPRRRLTQVAILGSLGGLYGWPFGPTYSMWLGGPSFYLAEGVGAIVGSAVGMLVGLRLFRNYPEKGPNKSPEPTPGAVTPRATEGTSK